MQREIIPVGIRFTGHAHILLQILFRVKPPQTTLLYGLGHRVVGSSGSTGLHLGSAELWLQEKMQQTVGQPQRALQDPVKQQKSTNYIAVKIDFIAIYEKTAVMGCFLDCVIFVFQYVKVQKFIDLWGQSYFSRNIWRPFIRSVICWALFRLKKGFFGGSCGNCTLQNTETKICNT